MMCSTAIEIMEPPSKRFKGLNAGEARDMCYTPRFRFSDDGYEARSFRPGAETLERIYSVGTLLCSQTLDTPANAFVPPPVQGRQGDSPCNGFRISYSQSYSRLSSTQEDDGVIQDEPAPGVEPPTLSFPVVAAARADAPTQMAVDISNLTPRDQASGPLPAVAALASRGRGDGPYQEVAVRPLRPNGRLSLTPELDVAEAREASASTSPVVPVPKLFPIFRPKSQWKTLHIIRHGESEYNAATSYGSGFADPIIFDPRLTAKGRRQAGRLRAELDKLAIPEGALWVTSPLTRAIETLMLARPSFANPEGFPDRLVVRSEISEQLVTTGDVGLPASQIRQRYPQLKEALKDLPERWWHHQKSNDAGQKLLGRTESKKEMMARVEAFRRWLHTRPETVILAFGHSTYFGALAASGPRLKNCEIKSLRI